MVQLGDKMCDRSISWVSGSLPRDYELGQINLKTITKNVLFLSPHDLLQIGSLFSANPTSDLHHPCGDSVGCYILKTGISLDVLFLLPSNKCFGCAFPCSVNFKQPRSIILHQHCSISCSHLLLWTRKAWQLLMRCVHFSEGDTHKPRKLIVDTIISKDNML